MQAIILAAGMGRRLGELTRDRTKGLVELHGRTLLERLLGQLAAHGVRRVSLVVGFHGDKVKAAVGHRWPGLAIEFIENPIYDRTNNIYSLFLAKERLLREDTLLLESDLVVEDAVFARLLADPRPDLALVAPCREWMDGTVLTLDGDDRITGMFAKHQIRCDQAAHCFKTVNIYKFSREFSRDQYVPFLIAYCQAMGHNEYYEQVLKVLSLLEKPTLRGLRLDREKWYEIDDVQDLAIAETLFAPPELALQACASRYGGYWRFPELLDCCYLVHPFFPPPRLLEELQGCLPTLVRNYPSGQAVLRHLAGRLFGLSSGQVLVGNGAAELILALQGDPGGLTGVVRPSFDEYAGRTPEARLRVHQAKAPEFAYSVAALLAFVEREQLQRLILVNPDNPTGHQLPAADLWRLAGRLREVPCDLVVDESFADFADPGARFSLLDRATLAAHPNLMVVKSLSKSYGVPGLRLGVAASSNEPWLRRLEARIAIWNINSVAEFFLQILGKYEVAYREGGDALAAERARFAAGLEATLALRVLPSAANFLFCEVLPPLTAPGLAQGLYLDHAILIKDCSTKAGLEGQPFVRIAIRGGADNDRFLAALRQVHARALRPEAGPGRRGGG